MAHHIIIGGGPAGVAAAETIRATAGPEAQITLISNEPAYSRMVLPYYLANDIPERHVLTGDAAYFEQHGITSVLGQVEKVDTQARTVTLGDGASHAFDTLLIATGSSAQRPPIAGVEQEGVYTFWTLEDAKQVMAKAQGTPRAVLIGAGFIGFIVLNAMAKLDWNLSVVETEAQVLPRMLDATGAQAVEGWLTSQHVAVHTGAQVQSISREGESLSLALSSGASLSADIVILATGIQPNLGFLDGSGIQVDGGIVVDDRMQTNMPGIYAAGDVAAGPDLLNGSAAVHAIQPTAVDHGRIAGANMAGKETHYPGSLLLNVLDVVNLHCASFGLWRDEGHDTTTVFNASRPIYRKYVWHQDRIVGALFVGPIDDVTMLNDVGMVKGLIQTQQPLGDWADYIKAHPTDIRRAYVASGAAQALIGRTLLGAPSRDRAYRVDGKTPPVWDKTANHAPLISTQSEHYRELNPTPTPGIGKAD
jgi:NAD(P)H-nitrite reductase large subunit